MYTYMIKTKTLKMYLKEKEILTEAHWGRAHLLHHLTSSLKCCT